MNKEDEIAELKNKLKIIFNKFIGKENISDKMNTTLNNEELEIICNNLIEKRKNQIINKDVLIDLEIFDGLGEDKNNNIFSYLDKTHTHTGKFLLKDILANPIDDTAILEKRQNIIKHLCKNNNLQKEINNKLTKISKFEEELLWFWKDLNDETKYLFNMVYFQNKYLKFLNTNEFVLKIYNYYTIIFSPLYGLISPIMMVLAPYIMIKFYFKTKVSLKLYFNILKKTLGSFSAIYKLKLDDLNKNTFSLSWGTIISLIIWIVFYIHNLLSNINNAKNTNEITNKIHTRLNNISQLVREGHNLHDLLINEIDENSLFIKSSVTKHFNILWNDIFSSTPKSYSNKGLILKTYKIIEMKKDKLIDLIKYIANIDCYHSISRLVSEKKMNYNFPEYIFNSRHPSIDIKGLFYPILTKKVVTNDIQIGIINPRNVIITGPNAGGKSTFIKSLCLSILLSQTLTICPAEYFKFTPFSLVSTYLNIPDTKGKESLFEVEMRRSLEYINTIKNLENKKFSFVIMDEIFSSTNPEEGISGAYAIANNISKNVNNISILTTHFSYLSNLEKTGKFKNYRIPIERDSDNNIVYKYKLQPGVSNQFIALELLEKKGFDKNIVLEAKDICRQINDQTKNANLKSIDRKKKLKKRISRNRKESDKKDLDKDSNKNKLDKDSNKKESDKDYNKKELDKDSKKNDKSKDSKVNN